MASYEKSDKLMQKIAISFMEITKHKNYRKISVSEIMSPLHVTRQTFYYYFQDIDDLIHWINVQTLDIPFQTFRETKSLLQAYEVALNAYIKDRAFFRNVISYMGDGPFEASLYKEFYEGMSEHIGPRRMTEDEKFSSQVYLRGTIPVYIDVIKNDKPVDVAKISMQLCKALPQNLIKYYDFDQFEVVPKRNRFWK